MPREVKSLTDLLIGEKGVILSFTDEELSLKLLEMGCLPGEAIVRGRNAPLGDPISITVSGYSLTLRKAEAETILIETGTL